MLQRVFWNIAGIDRETLATCPVTDNLWATQLAYALYLSFIVIFGISFHATRYVIEQMMMRQLTALEYAITVFMFDRVLYQSDWFYQGIIKQPGSPAGKHEPAELGQSARRILRITMRLAISFGLAWIIALFLEL